MNKKLTVFIGSVLTVISFFLFFFAKDLKGSLCGAGQINCWELYNLFAIISFFGPALLISSLTVLKRSEEVFQKWKRFTVSSIVVYLVVVTLMPWEVGDEIAGFTKGMVGLVLSILYFVVSLIYVFALSKKRAKM